MLHHIAAVGGSLIAKRYTEDDSSVRNSGEPSGGQVIAFIVFVLTAFLFIYPAVGVSSLLADPPGFCPLS